jgi:hypothetical protein
LLFALRGPKLIKLGRPPAMNSNGPILWHGRKDLWAFDNYDCYKRRDEKSFRFARILMKVGKDGKLHPWKTIRTDHPRVPDTVFIERLYNVPARGF